MNETMRYVGAVNWYDPQKGFGFVRVDGIDDDILLHAQVLRRYGQVTVLNQSEIECSITQTVKGLQVQEIYSIAASGLGSAQIAVLENLGDAELQQLSVEPARVKWFDAARGYGFANVFGSKDDIFVHIDVLKASGFSTLATGEAIAIRVYDGRRGRMAAEVLAWEAPHS